VRNIWISLAISIQHITVTHRRTDRQTDRHWTTASAALQILLHCKTTILTGFKQ